MTQFVHELGSKAKSKMTGFQGTVSSRSQNLYGCNRYFLNPSVGADGKLPDGYWFDEADIEVLDEPKLEAPESNRGGPISKRN